MFSSPGPKGSLEAEGWLNGKRKEDDGDQTRRMMEIRRRVPKKLIRLLSSIFQIDLNESQSSSIP